jgi:predicted ester cyclase
MTDLAANKATAVRFLDAVTTGDVDTLLTLITPDWRMTGGPPGLPHGAEGIHALFASIGPIEQTWTVEDVIAEGDRVVVRATNTCVQESFFGVPAKDVRQVFTATFTFRLDDGRIAETWRNADDLGRLLQLGARITAPH